MKLQRLDHFTLRTTRLEQTRAFYERIAGLRQGPRPPFAFPGHWLYLGDLPVLHLAAPALDAALEGYLGRRKSVEAGGTGAVDHIAFRGLDLPSFEQRLREEGCHYRGRTVPEAGEHQVFLSDPNGVTVEFIFPSTEPASWQGMAPTTPEEETS
jgi:catechol 2,3-dioxygenase-like lactoylglutathione lyase family enzyme